MSDNKAVKTALKAARENIDKKEWKVALGCCKKALNIDRTNYLALVFCGLCLTESNQPDQAIQAYKKAVEAQPAQLQGWQDPTCVQKRQTWKTGGSTSSVMI